MKILHVVDMISQQRGGGSAKVPYQLGEAQARLGHKVTIYASDFHAEDQLPPKGVELKKFHCALNLLGGVRITPSMVFADFSQFDIVHLHNYRTLVNIIAANKGRPYIVQALGSCLPINGLTIPLHNFIWRNLILKRASALIAIAEMEIGQYVAEGADSKRISLIPAGIKCNEFNRRPARVKDGKKRVLFLGRFHEDKSPVLLAKAIKILNRNDVILLMAGYDDGCEKTMRRQIKELGIEDKVDYIGARYGKDKADTYAMADIYIMPSRREVFGLTLLEALACGTPVIATDRCGVASLLPPECGLVVPFDEYALAKAINEALDKDIASSYREYRIKWAKQYDWSKIAPKIIEVYRKVLGT
ncbi:hypothetical protein LCGC14_1326970 [marine sediment metagenome]|uniref:Glycosyl transferase family 1 domain-containing protein n=1 Tax=marine sediment metagenome TaxID=412755 RepID=A0A0F9KIC1_9ZZZZ